MKFTKKLLILLFALVMALSLVACKESNQEKTSVQTTKEEFDNFTNELFIKEVQTDSITLNYTLDKPKSYGIEIGEAKVGHFSPSYIKSELSAYENYLAILDAFDYDKLIESQQLTYDILHYYFNLELTQNNVILYHDVLGPTTGIQAQLPILLAEYNISSKEDLDTYLALVESVHSYYEEVCEFQKLKSDSNLFMNKKSAESIINQCEDFIKDSENNFLIETVNSKITSLPDLTEEEVSYYKDANTNVVINSLIPSYEMLIATLKEHQNTGVNDKGLYYYENGKEFYEYLMAYYTNSDKSVPQLKEMVEKSINQSIATMGRILTEDPSIYDNLLTETFPLTDPNDIITYLKGSISDDFPEIIDVNCKVEYIPEPLQDHLSPAMYLVPAIDDYKNNIIYINPTFDMSNIFPTMAHEAYPGHLYQSVYFRETNPPSIRNLISFGGYIEGWATYVEYYSYYLAGFDKNVADFIVANMVTNMGIYCMLDIGIHYEGWTLADAYNYLLELGIEDKDLTTILYDIIIEEPCMYPQYGIGYLEIIKLKDKAISELGEHFVLKDFHTFLLDIGPAPFPIIQDRLDEEVAFILKKAS